MFEPTFLNLVHDQFCTQEPLALSFWGALIGAALSGLTGLFGNKDQTDKTTTTNQSNSSSSTSGTQSNGFNLSAGQNALLDKIFTQPKTPFDRQSYSASGLQDINAGSDITKRMVENMTAKNGLSFSPAGFNPQAQVENNRVAQQNQFLTNVPLVERQAQEEDFNDLLKSFAAVPLETNSTFTNNGTQNSSSQGTGTQTNAGQPTGGLLGGLTSALFSPNGSGSGNMLDSILKGLGIGK